MYNHSCGIKRLIEWSIRELDKYPDFVKDKEQRDRISKEFKWRLENRFYEEDEFPKN